MGLATAWGGNAVADATLKLEVSPQQTLTNAFVLYGNNVSTGVIRSLGTILGGETTTFYHSLIVDQIPNCDWVCDPASYVVPPGDDSPFNPYPRYALIGLYQGDDGPGITVSFPNNDPIVNMSPWSSLFESSTVSSFNFAESDVIDDLSNVLPNVAFDLLTVYLRSGSFIPTSIGTPYGSTAVLVNFSDATFGGAAIATLVPEPASFVLLIGTVGIALTTYRRRAGE
jgi:hypothetical protein